MAPRQRVNGYSSLGYSVESYMPYYAPPAGPPRGQVQEIPAAMLTPAMTGQQIDQHTTLVNRMPRLLGIRWLYSRGAQSKPWFKMVATGRVESTKFQPLLAYTWSGEFNDALYQAGYPRNLGYTFKVPTYPGYLTPGPTMQPAPQIRRPYFSKRAFTSGQKPEPLIGTPRNIPTGPTQPSGASSRHMQQMRGMGRRA